MRGEASRIADRVSRDSLAPKLRDSGEDAWRIGNELFTITNVLDHNIQLERALTDPSRPVEDKVAVVKTLIGDDAHPLTMEIMSDLVARRWSRVSDIANAAEDFGVDGMMYGPHECYSAGLHRACPAAFRTAQPSGRTQQAV